MEDRRDLTSSRARGALGGALLSLAAAAAFGVFAPAAKGALTRLEPLAAAGLTYLAAGLAALGVSAVRRMAGARSFGRGAARADLPRLAAIVLAGGIVGPVLFFAGLARVMAHRAAVLQHVEFALTVLAAVAVLGERPGRRGLLGLGLVGAGLLLLSSAGGGAASATGPATSLVGTALLVAACAVWAVDNTLARGASDLDPLVVVALKGLGAGSILVLATIGELRSIEPAGWALVVLAGGVGVGLSLVLELLALRRIGAALNAGLFATGPAFGFAWSVLFLGETAGARSFAALALCAAGAVALSVDRHGHRHVHEPLRHAHGHDHLDGHHAHAHDPEVPPATVHVHEHEHPLLDHAHPHVHDAHHRHRHRRAPSGR